VRQRTDGGFAKKNDVVMKTYRTFAAALFASAVFLPLTLPSGLAQAQQPAAAIAAPRIDGFDVEPVAQLAAGNELAFTLYGSPGGTARVRVGGATGSLVLAEVEAGVYEGTYTIGRRDHITANSTATANLRVGNRVASSVLDESLVTGASGRRPGSTAPASGVPRIDRFEVNPPNRLAPGEELMFTLSGSPGGTASARIDGIKGKVALDEVRAGVYEGAYTVKNRDQIAANTGVTGTLRLGDQERSAVLGQALVQSSPHRSQQSTRRAAAPAPVCANCGTVEAINVIEVKGNGNYLGMIAGGVGGALLGSQVGHGQGTTVAELLGAAGGALAGNEIQKRMQTAKHYEVVVRLENGGSQTVSYPAQPALSVGSRVRVENGALVAI
jgi:outer membrane lipoprotein SlyB